MPDQERSYSLSFRAPVSIFTGLGIAGLVDRAVVRDAGGLPYIPGSSVKGRLRFFAERLLRSSGVPDSFRIHASNRPHCKHLSTACTICRLFGSSSLPALIRVGQATLREPWVSLLLSLHEADPNPVVHPDVEIRPGIALSRRRRTALPDHLFLDETVPAFQFQGKLVLAGEVTSEEEGFLVGIGLLVDSLGARKAIGRGILEGGVRIQGGSAR
jgi:CRISPR/Cas system CSM-associated protein Csm3 (group 7 of RAMP superfamily)